MGKADNKKKDEKLQKRGIKAIQRSLPRKIKDLLPVDLPILRDYLVHLLSKGEDGFNPKKAGSQDHRQLLN